MTKFRFAAAAALAAVISVAFVGGAAAGHDPAGSPVVGQLYINDNTAPANTVGGFDRHADGSLTPLAGSPFAVGGSGTGSATASQGALQLSSDGRYLLAVDAGSNQISVLRIKADGSLQPADLESSNGVDPVSIAEYDGLVYVANAGNTAPNYTGFSLNAGGHLRAISGSTVSLPTGSQPGDVLFSGDGTKVAGTRVGTSLIDSFTVGNDGLLTASGPAIAAQGLGPFGSEFRPTDPTQLFVSNAHNGGPTNGTVSAFSVAANAALTPIGSSPFGDNQSAPCWVELSHDGQFLFAVNTGDSTISSYSIAANGSLSLLGSVGFKGGLVGPEDARLSPDGSTLWVVEAGAHNAVAGFSVSGGTLKELASSATPGPAGATPSGIVVT